MSEPADSSRDAVLLAAMISVLVHDLRSPLTAIAASAELVCRTAGSELPREAGERIKRSARRMARSMAQMLDFAEIRSGPLRLDRAESHLGEIVAAAIAEARQSLPSARIEHRPEGDLTGRFDAERLHCVVANLLSNALVHGAPGQPVQVTVDGASAHELTVRVVNAGALPPHRQACTFAAAPAAPAGSARLELGLYVVEQFVLAHGGRVSGRSVEGGSTVFEFSIPRAG